MKKIFIIITILSLMMYSCSDSVDSKPSDQTQTIAPTPAATVESTKIHHQKIFQMN